MQDVHFLLYNPSSSLDYVRELWLPLLSAEYGGYRERDLPGRRWHTLLTLVLCVSLLGGQLCLTCYLDVSSRLRGEAFRRWAGLVELEEMEAPNDCLAAAFWNPFPESVLYALMYAGGLAVTTYNMVDIITSSIHDEDDDDDDDNDDDDGDDDDDDDDDDDGYEDRT